LIDHIKDVEVLWIPDEKGREEAYQTALNTCNCEELVKIIKTLYVRNESRIADGKKMTNSDRKYLKLAEEFLYGELALPLGIEKSEVEAFIIEKCDLQQEETTWKVKEQ
ncbi:MAG: CarD family transcriptional regulator, partial [Acetivibrio sp.]